MNNSLQKLSLRLVLSLCSVVLFSSGAFVFAQEPNDIKTGSVLFFNHYTSNPFNPAAEDTQLNITNTHPSSSVVLHIFAVDPTTCQVADSFAFLTANQTAQFFASDFDPGTRGYLFVVAFSGDSPRNFNFLTGTAYIHRADGKMADLPAVAVSRRGGAVVDNGDGSISLPFDGVTYDRLPGTVALSNFNSQVTDSTTMYLYSPRNFFTGDASTISVFTLVFNELERAVSTSFSIRCYSEIQLSSLRVLFTLNGFIPAGQVGWLKMSAGRPLMGASLSRGPNFSGGRNLTILSLFPSWSIIIPGTP
ncbi:MAG TPA: hypothetical protein VFD58_36095 [Blastocatellia bacterium]|nr:hypothetical protein [Blastocatellia bacterium]